MTIDIDFGGDYGLYNKLKNDSNGFNADYLGEKLRVVEPLSMQKLIFMIYGGFTFTNIIGDAPEIIGSGTKDLITKQYSETDFNVCSSIIILKRF